MKIDRTLLLIILVEASLAALAWYGMSSVSAALTGSLLFWAVLLITTATLFGLLWKD